MLGTSWVRQLFFFPSWAPQLLRSPQFVSVRASLAGRYPLGQDHSCSYMYLFMRSSAVRMFLQRIIVILYSYPWGNLFTFSVLLSMRHTNRWAQAWRSAQGQQHTVSWEPFGPCSVAQQWHQSASPGIWTNNLPVTGMETYPTEPHGAPHTHPRWDLTVAQACGSSRQQNIACLRF